MRRDIVVCSHFAFIAVRNVMVVAKAPPVDSLIHSYDSSEPQYSSYVSFVKPDKKLNLCECLVVVVVVELCENMLTCFHLFFCCCFLPSTQSIY